MEKFQSSICDRARREVVVGLALLIVTMGSFILFFALNYFHTRGILEQYLPASGAERVFYNLIFLVFMFGSFTYQVSRLAFFWNVRSRVASTQRDLQRFSQNCPTKAPHVEIIVPSYKEETSVIWQTLMSAALVDYPNRGIVLLIDNPPDPADPVDANLLIEARRQAPLIAELFAPLAIEFENAARDFSNQRFAEIGIDRWSDDAAALYEKAANFLENLAADVRHGKFGGADDHTRQFFVQQILLQPAAAHRARGERLRAGNSTHEDLVKEFDRLDYMFRVRLNTFERKQYANLSQVATKAANLNSYISLMGGRFDVVIDEAGRTLVEQATRDRTNDDAGECASVTFPDASFVIILDADSFLLPEYATCMLSTLQAPENERVAVMQTPYTTIPNTPHLIERAAAATTDIYYYVTEGMSFANAGSWIGAAAAIRKAALLDIVVYQQERGYRIPIYIQDTTVIEDTGATIDLARRNWSVQNYPARLSYSATPSDFGALVIQRCRWSNGGLIILPSALGYLFSLRANPRNFLEALLRIHYMIMPACISTSMLAMLLYPFDFKYVSSWIYITLPPYIYLVCRDLAHTGYRRRDFFKAYTLFLILLPVVLIGVANSIVQIVLGKKANFGRTPKVAHRTAAPALVHLAIIGLFVWSALTAYDDLRSQLNQLHAVFALSNALAVGYGIVVLIGIRETLQDLSLPLLSAARRMRAKFAKGAAADAFVVSPPLQPSTAQSTTSVTGTGDANAVLSSVEPGAMPLRATAGPITPSENAGKPEASSSSSTLRSPELQGAIELQWRLRTAIRRKSFETDQRKTTGI